RAAPQLAQRSGRGSPAPARPAADGQQNARPSRQSAANAAPDQRSEQSEERTGNALPRVESARRRACAASGAHSGWRWSVSREAVPQGRGAPVGGASAAWIVGVAPATDPEWEHWADERSVG